MTRRLYYTDSYLKEFSGTVLERRRVGNGIAVILDQTAFYPTSGGQPHDTGSLGGARVLDVLEGDSGEVIHVLDGDVGAGSIFGCVDWARRFDHMQQHTGQHILSQSFIRVAQAPTLSFHLGEETSTIDLNLAPPSPAQIEEVQAHATQVVFDDRPVHILTTDRDKLGSLGVRKESQREGEIRVIDIEEFDRSACGGTHVRRSGEVGMIFVLNFERYKGGTRIEFVAGNRALKAFQRDHDLLRKLARIHSAAPESLPGLAEKLLQERMDVSRENDYLKSQLLEMEAAELLRNAPRTGCASVIRRVYAGRSLEQIKLLAQKLTARPDILAILGASDASQLVVARSRNLPGDCNAAVKKIAAELGGKGGGRPELAQAGGFPADSLDLWLQSLEKYFL